MRSSNRSRTRAGHTAIAVALALTVAVAGCGDDSDDGDAGSAGSDSAAAATTVSVESVEGVGDVLVDSDGAALYTADQERDGKVRCTADCADIWIPLTLPGGDEPSGSDDLSGELGVAKRPGGERQVSFEGKPLYRFADDGMPGEVSGDGLSDTFSGRMFSWQVVTTDASSAESGQGSGAGGFGY
jgi:predicted lipoprotein with Yx(FWY)xxD motif